MKKSIIALVLLLTACTGNDHPKFKVGDCVALDRKTERWEKQEDNNVYKIVEVGKEHYRAVYITPSDIKGKESTVGFFVMDYVYNQIECPK